MNSNDDSGADTAGSNCSSEIDDDRLPRFQRHNSTMLGQIDNENEYKQHEFSCSLRPQPDPNKADWILCKVPRMFRMNDCGYFFVRSLYELPDEYEERDIFIRSQELTYPNLSYLLPLTWNDRLDVLLYKPKSQDKLPIKPAASKATLIAYCGTRTLGDIQKYFLKCSEWLSDCSSRLAAVNSITSSDALWLFLWNAKPKDDKFLQVFKELVIKFALNFANHVKSRPAKLKIALEGLIASNYLDDQKEYIMELSTLIVEVDPSLLKKIMPLLSKTIRYDSNSNQLVRGMFELFQKVGKVADLSDWKTLQQIPLTEELLGGPLERSKYLSPVVLETPYPSVESYLSVYYRLLRTECFSAIQKGIIELLEGRLNPRDMDVYKNVKFVGVEKVQSRIIVFLQFSIAYKNINWMASKKLMFGNLLCATASGDFSDCIWMTVSERNVEILQKKSVIGVELISLNDSNSNLFNRLIVNSGRLIMAESPTYFQSFRHVLTSLKQSELNEFNLRDEIVYGKSTEDVHADFDQEKYDKYFTIVKTDILEDHQKVAFFHALKSPLGIIQGPPGTGKTFVGAKLAHFLVELIKDDKLNDLLGPFHSNYFKREEIINEEKIDGSDNYGTSSDDSDEYYSDEYDSDDSDSFRNKLLRRELLRRELLKRKLLEEKEKCANPPILVLTYKNHALDEFLKHCLTFCDSSDITRIGKRSKEEQLNDCLLHEKVKKYVKQCGRIYFDREIRDVTAVKCEELSRLLEQFGEQKCFTFKQFLTRLTTDQLKSFAITALQKPFIHPPRGLKVKQFRYVVTPQYVNDLVDYYGDQLNRILLNIDNSQPDLRYLTMKMLNAFTHFWLPGRRNLLNLTQLSLKGTSFLYSSISTDEEDSKKDSHDDEDDLDEDYINEQMMLRTSAIDGVPDDKLNIKKLIQNYEFTENIMSGNADFTLLDFPKTCKIDYGLVATKDLWNLNYIDKYSYIYSSFHLGLEDIVKEINDVFEDIEILQQKKKTIDDMLKARVLKTQKIVGATIVGASIQLSLIRKLSPKVVIVEEAAEVLESCLVAALSKSVQKLILIGDHMQLRPQVDTYYLRKEHNFHISMMERLIILNFPYRSLVKQGRMRTEFSKMLKDIYPNYDDFDGLDTKNVNINCIPKSMFFWNHSFPENKDRSAKNEGEAQMVVALALYLIVSGVKEEDVTIICGYLGQVQLVRKMLRSYCETFNGNKKYLIHVSTIDDYQGDENEYVIISLTRSNQKKILGFMKEQERRCVAQSRAKCGLYFVGNFEMFKGNKTWEPLTSIMEKEGCVGNELPIQCYRHPLDIHHVVQSTNILSNAKLDEKELMFYVRSKNNWCDIKCNVLFDCEIEEHRCKKLCTPRHDDLNCRTLVPYVFPECGHSTEKPCYVEKLTCRTQITNTLMCTHSKTTTCHIWRNKKQEIKCLEPCLKKYNCKFEHECKKSCSAEDKMWSKYLKKYTYSLHDHDATACPEPVTFDFEKCGHTAHIKKECGRPIPRNIPCNFQLNYEIEVCGHAQSRLCSEEEKCQHPCSRLRPDCGHSCENLCFDVCVKDECDICKAIVQKTLQAARNYAMTELENLQISTKFELSLMMEGLEYDKIKEHCHIIFNMHTSYNIRLDNVWKIESPSKYTATYLTRCSKAFGSSREQLCHFRPGFITEENIESPEDLYGKVFDKGFFKFFRYASEDLTKKSNEFTIIVAEVLTGDSIDSLTFFKNPKKAKKGKKKKKIKGFEDKLKDLEKDSIIVSNTTPSIHMVHGRNQIKLLYLINLYTEEKPQEEVTVDFFKDYEDRKEHVFDLSEVNLQWNICNPLVENLLKAMALYKGDCCNRSAYEQSKEPMKEIKKIGIVINRQVDEKYETAKAELENNKFSEVFAYHATAPKNVASIVQRNLDPNREKVHGRAHGDGCYFSEHPQFSFRYGRATMLVFKLLLIEGKYKKVAVDSGGFCRELILKDSAHFKPVYVLRF